MILSSNWQIGSLQRAMVQTNRTFTPGLYAKDQGLCREETDGKFCLPNLPGFPNLLFNFGTDAIEPVVYHLSRLSPHMKLVIEMIGMIIACEIEMAEIHHVIGTKISNSD